MNYEPNTRQWKVGDLVIHDYDYKRDYMLMRVIGFTRDGEVQTRYIEEYTGSPRSLKSTTEIWTNPIEYLHDPTRFNISLPTREQANDQR